MTRFSKPAIRSGLLVPLVMIAAACGSSSSKDSTPEHKLLKAPSNGTSTVVFSGDLNETRHHGGDALNGLQCQLQGNFLNLIFMKAMVAPGDESQVLELLMLSKRLSNQELPASFSEEVVGVYQLPINNQATFYQQLDNQPLCSLEFVATGMKLKGSFSCKDLKSTKEPTSSKHLDATGSFECEVTKSKGQAK